MKIFSILILVLTSTALADLLPPGQKPIEVCEKFENVEKDDHMLVVAAWDRRGGDVKVDATPVKPDECFNTGYMQAVKVIAVATKDWQANAGKDGKTVKVSSKKFGEAEGLNPVSKDYVEESSTITKRTVTYKLTGVKGGKLLLQKTGSES